MAKRFVEYRGVRMIEGWPEEIQEAQLLTSLPMAGAAIPRIAFGAERADLGANEHPCRDCRVFKGEFHVPGCDGEECVAGFSSIIRCRPSTLEA